MIGEKLPEGFKRKWVEALRSGKFIQTDSYLYNPDLSEDGRPAMCCLGVAEYISGTPLEDMNDPDIHYPSDLENPKSPLILRNPIDNHVCINLGLMNDGVGDGSIRKHSFNEIADYIQENL